MELHPDLYGCKVFCGSGPDRFLAFFFLGGCNFRAPIVPYQARDAHPSAHGLSAETPR